MHRLTVRTERREQMLDITDALAGAITELGVADGAVLVHVPHTTAAVTVNEGYDPDVALAEGMRRSVRWCLDNGIAL